MTARESHDDEAAAPDRVYAIIERTHAAVTAAIAEGLLTGEAASQPAERAVAMARAGAEEAVLLAQTTVAKILRGKS